MNDKCAVSRHLASNLNCTLSTGSVKNKNETNLPRLLILMALMTYCRTLVLFYFFYIASKEKCNVYCFNSIWHVEMYFSFLFYSFHNVIEDTYKDRKKVAGSHLIHVSYHLNK